VPVSGGEGQGSIPHARRRKRFGWPARQSERKLRARVICVRGRRAVEDSGDQGAGFRRPTCAPNSKASETSFRAPPLAAGRSVSCRRAGPRSRAPKPRLRARIGVDLVDSADSAVAVEDVIVLVLPGSGLAGLVAAAQDELGRRFEGLVPWNSIRAMAELHHGAGVEVPNCGGPP
jgi:hypothetical protein